LNLRSGQGGGTRAGSFAQSSRCLLCGILISSECGSTWALSLVGTASSKAVLWNITGGSLTWVMSWACLAVSLAVFADWHVDVVGAAAGCYCWASAGTEACMRNCPVPLLYTVYGVIALAVDLNDCEKLLRETTVQPSGPCSTQ